MSKKATPTTKAATNGKHAPTPQTKLPDALSDQDRQKLKLYLDKHGNPFTVSAAPLSRKRKRDAQSLQIQDDLFEDRLSVQYEVKPRDKWESLRKYKKFTVGSESIATGQCILVKHDESEDARVDLQEQWKAKVLEVRALDTEHVYVRVAWLNRPEDLESGRKEYHGKNELIPSNQMDIIDAMAVNGTFDIVRWDDSDESDPSVNDEQFFWRQTFDQVDTKTFSKLRIMCVDNAPQNPDEMIIQCSDEACRKWLHVKCIAEKAVKVAGEASSSKKKKKAPAPNSTVSSNSSAIAIAATGNCKAEVFVKGVANEPGTKQATTTEIVVTNADGEQRTEELCCLHCGKPIKD